VTVVLPESMCAAIPMLRTRDRRSCSTGSRFATMSSWLRVDGSSLAFASLEEVNRNPLLPQCAGCNCVGCTYTCAATDCHLLCWLLIHVSVFTPLVKGVRDAVAVESAHREGVREAVRAALRRPPAASDCALARDCILISSNTRHNKKAKSEGTTLATLASTVDLLG
jgi:hypothetical protein